MLLKANWKELELKNRGIPKIYWDIQAKDFPPNIRDGLLKEKGSVFITGKNGRGKSYLAAALALKNHGDWVNIPTLLIRVRRCMSDFAIESEHAIMKAVISKRYLVLDDIFAANKSEFTLSWLFAIVNARVESNMPTVVTCDRELSVVKKINPSLASRLGGFVSVHLNGPDRRMRKNGCDIGEVR